MIRVDSDLEGGKGETGWLRRLREERGIAASGSPQAHAPADD